MTALLDGAAAAGYDKVNYVAWRQAELKGKIMALDARPNLKEPAAVVDYESNLPYPDPQTPQEDFANDIVISLRQVKAGDVCDLEEVLQEIESELGIDAE